MVQTSSPLQQLILFYAEELWVYLSVSLAHLMQMHLEMIQALGYVKTWRPYRNLVVWNMCSKAYFCVRRRQAFWKWNTCPWFFSFFSLMRLAKYHEGKKKSCRSLCQVTPSEQGASKISTPWAVPQGGHFRNTLTPWALPDTKTINNSSNKILYFCFWLLKIWVSFYVHVHKINQ